MTVVAQAMPGEIPATDKLERGKEWQAGYWAGRQALADEQALDSMRQELAELDKRWMNTIQPMLDAGSAENLLVRMIGCLQARIQRLETTATHS